MMGIKLRTCFICGLVIACCGAMYGTESLFEVTIRQPSISLSDLSMVLSGWKGEAVAMDEEIVRFAGANTSISRVYQREGEVPVAVYAAVWADPSVVDNIAPHLPTICYPNAGWTLERQKDVPIGDAFTVSLSEFSRAGDKVVTAHWYQLGDLHYTDSLSARAGLSSLWGQREWSPVVKILLQTQSSSIEDAESRLTNIAGEVNRFVSAIR